LFLLRIRLLKRVIITGGTGGLGKAISEQFGGAGWEVTRLGSKDLNLTDRQQVADYFAAHPCDLLICAAGIIADQPIFKMDPSTWDEVFSINFTAAKICALEAISQMVARGNGHVVFISSYAALHPGVGQAAYATAKAALLGLTQGLAAEFGSNGIRINSLLPGFLESKMTDAVTSARKQEVKKLHTLGEFNTPERVAEFIQFLDERMAMTSGQIFQLDSRL